MAKSKVSKAEELVRSEGLAAEENPDAPLKAGTKVTRPGRARSAVYSIRLTPDEVQAVNAAADLAGVPASVLVRGWVRQGLATQRNDDPAAIAEQLAHDVARLRRSLPASA
ncbi:hypothetical protein ACFQU4_34505 [Microlunatus sp. GCM10028923]